MTGKRLSRCSNATRSADQQEEMRMQGETEPIAPATQSASDTRFNAARGGVLRQPGFGWGLGVGAIVVVLLVALAVGVLGLVYLRLVSDNFAQMAGPATNVTLTPVEAGEPWFSINDDGTGVLEGWSIGTYGDGVSTQYAFDVFEVGSVDGVPIQHVITMGADDDTVFFVGERPYEVPDTNSSAAADVFGDTSDEGNPLMDGEMKLTIEFRREGDTLMATKVTGDPTSEPAPFLW